MQKSSYIEVLLMVVIVSAVGYGTVFIGAMTAPNVMDWNLADSPDPYDQAILESQWYPTGQSGTEIMHDQAILNPLPSPPSLTGNDDQRIEIIEDDTRQEENAIKNDVGNYWLNKLLRRVDVRKEASDSQGIVWPIVNFLGRFFGF